MTKKQRKKLKQFVLAMTIMAKDHEEQRMKIIKKSIEYIKKEGISQKDFDALIPELTEEVFIQENLTK